MQLSEHDLKQLDEERAHSLGAERLQTLSLKLLADLKEAHDRLNQSPENSSRPPSSRAPWERASSDAQDDDEQEDDTPREADGRGEDGAEPNDPSSGAQGPTSADLQPFALVFAGSGQVVAFNQVVAAVTASPVF